MLRKKKGGGGNSFLRCKNARHRLAPLLAAAITTHRDKLNIFSAGSMNLPLFQKVLCPLHKFHVTTVPTLPNTLPQPNLLKLSGEAGKRKG